MSATCFHWHYNALIVKNLQFSLEYCEQFWDNEAEALSTHKRTLHLRFTFGQQSFVDLEIDIVRNLS